MEECVAISDVIAAFPYAGRPSFPSKNSAHPVRTIRMLWNGRVFQVANQEPMGCVLTKHLSKVPPEHRVYSDDSPMERL